jgi:hypothetical protein
VLFEGPVDVAVPDSTATELVATLREALSNVARHAAGQPRRRGRSAVEPGAAVLVVTVVGVGIPAERDGGGTASPTWPGGRSGAAGRSPAVAVPGGGTVVEWRVPID